METNTEKISLRTCMVDGVKLFFKNIPFIFVFGVAGVLLLILRGWIISFLRSEQMYAYDGIFHFLSTHSLIFHILLSIIFNLVTLMGTIFIIAKSLAILRQEDFSLKSAFETIRPNVLKLIVVGTVMYILSSARTFAWMIIFWLAENSIIDTIPIITMPWMRTPGGISPSPTSPVTLIANHIISLDTLMTILIGAIGVLAFTGIGIYMISHIVGGYENGFIKGAFSAVKRTIAKMFILSVVLTLVMDIATLPRVMIMLYASEFSYMLPAFDTISIVFSVSLPFYAITTFTALYFHATKKIET